MKSYTLDLGAINGKVTILINRKKIKNVHLKVYRDLSVRLNLPDIVPDEWIKGFLENKKDWIDKQLTKYKSAEGYNNLRCLKSGSSTQYLGKDVRIIKEQSDCNAIQMEEKVITVYLKDLHNNDLFERLFQKWWREQAYNIYIDELKKLYDKIFKKHEIPFPSLSIRKMDTLWGSCIKAKNKIILNEYLLKADRLCIQYVVLHELIHMLYNKHDANFYNFLTIHMPDWKERKNRLDLEIVNGL